MHKTTKYKQGNSWTVSRWSHDYGCYYLTDGLTYAQASRVVREDNA